MPWIRLEVVEPPKLESVQLTLHPPEYTGLPVETSEKSTHALRGTRVELSGTSTKKLRSVRVCQDNGPELAAQLSADSYGFTLGAEAKEPLVVDHSGSYWILLEDVEGLTVVPKIAGIFGPLRIRCPPWLSNNRRRIFS